MGVHDPGGGILHGNYYELLETEPKRKIGKRNKIISLDNECTEEEIFLLMEATTKDLSRVNPFLIAKILDNAINGKPTQVNRLKDGKLLIQYRTE